MEDSNKAVTRPSGSPSWSASQDVVEARRKAGAGFNYRAAERAAIQGYAEIAIRRPDLHPRRASLLLVRFHAPARAELVGSSRIATFARRGRRARHDGAASELRRQDDVRRAAALSFLDSRSRRAARSDESRDRGRASTSVCDVAHPYLTPSVSSVCQSAVTRCDGRADVRPSVRPSVPASSRLEESSFSGEFARKRASR